MALAHWFDRWSLYVWPLLFDHIWQATLISAAVFAGLYVLRQAPASARYRICLVASAKFLIPSALLGVVLSAAGVDIFARDPGATLSARAVPLAKLSAPATQMVDSAATAAEVRSDAAFARLHPPYLAATAIWLAGFLLTSGFWVKKRIGLKFMLRYAKVIDDGTGPGILSSLKTQMRITQPVQLALLPLFVEPGVLGVWNPIILMPATVFDDLNEQERKTILMHELEHVKRRDNLVADLHMWLCCLLWFHPLVWIVDRKLLEERERVCDDRVLGLGAAADDYLSGLLKVQKFCLRYQIAGASYATGANFKRRIESIMNDRRHSEILASHRVVFGSVCAIVMALSIVSGSLGRSTRRVAFAGVGGERSRPADIAERLGHRDNALAEQVDVPFDNVDGAPLTILGAIGILINPKARPQDADGNGREIVRMTVTLVNNTDRNISEIALEHYPANSSLWSRTLTLCSIASQATYTWESDTRITNGIDSLRFRLGAARLDGGSTWGTFAYPLPVNQARVRVEPTFSDRSGVGNGPVTVEVDVDEAGNVESARAVSGPADFADAAVAAAYRWKWVPFTEDGRAIKKVGTISFAVPRSASHEAEY